MNRFYKIGLGLALTVVVFNGCTPSKQIDELKAEIKDLKARVEAIEKVVMPSKPMAQQHAYEIPVDDSPVLGKKDAPVHITVFSNFQCPYCARADKALRSLLNDPELAGKVNIIFKHFPFEKERHPEARPASKAVLAVQSLVKAKQLDENLVWNYVKLLFENQAELNAKKYKELAVKIGLNGDEFEKDLKENDAKYDERINKDKKLGEEVAKLEGTPWILVGGWLLEGNIDGATIKKMIADKKL